MYNKRIETRSKIPLEKIFGCFLTLKPRQLQLLQAKMNIFFNSFYFSKCTPM